MPESEQQTPTGLKKQKRRRRFAWITAFVVLSSFLVKDELQEKLRQIDESIARAERGFNDERQYSPMFEGLASLSNELDLIEGEIPRKQARSADNVRYFRTTTTSMRKFDIANLLVGIEELIRQLPPDPRLKKRADDLIEANMNGDTPPYAGTTILAMDLFTRLEARRQHYRTAYRVSSYVSYFLFAGGWALGLAGKLYGLD
jgi:hypothetical protein